MMDSTRVQRAEEIFQAAADLGEDERQEHVERACGDDAELRALVFRLLACHEGGMGDFLDDPIAVLGDVDRMLEEKTGGLGRIGRYEIVRVIGEGGMGTIFLATQENPRRTVALKIMRPGLASAAVLRRFKLEGDILGRLQHPGIAHIYEAGTARLGPSIAGMREQPFLAMEYVEGQPLTSYARSHNLTLRQRLELLAKVCDAVQHAHQKGVIHRDLKPANIVVEAGGQPKVLDFGVARLVDRGASMATRETEPGQLVGTLAYMSPEQIAGDPDEIDTRCDVYALGVILFELVAERLPFACDGVPVSLAARRILEEQPVRLSSINRSLRGDVETIAMKAMEKDKARRYASASDLAADLHRHLRGEPIDARRDSGWYVLGRTLRRQKLVVSFTAAIVVIVVTSAITLGFMYADQRLQRQRAERQARRAEAVNTFLQHILAYTDPLKEGTDPDAKVRDLLANAERELERGAFGREPLVEADLRKTIGVAYRHLGLFEEALRHVEAAWKIHQRALGADDPQTAESLNLTARLLGDLGETDRAIEMHRSAIEVLRGLPPDRRAPLAVALNDLAALLDETGRIQAAEPLHREALAIRRTSADCGDLEVAQSLSHLGGLCLIREELEQAEELLRQALEIRQRELGEMHPLTGYTLNNLGNVIQRSGRLEEAEAVFREALRVNRACLGEDHPQLVVNLANLAALRSDRGDHAGAEELLHQSLALARRAYGPRHAMVGITLAKLGRVLSAAGRAEEMETALQEALPILSESLGTAHPTVIVTKHNLAMAVHQRGDSLAAAEMLREIVDGFDASTVEPPLRAGCLSNLGVVLADLGEIDAALEALHESEVIWRGAAGDDHPAVFRVRGQAGATLIEAGRAREAVEVLRPVLGFQRRTMSSDHPDLGVSLLNLGRALLAQQDAEAWNEAEDLFREAARMVAATLPSDHWKQAEVKCWLAACLLKQDSPREAEALLNQARATLGQQPRPLARQPRAVRDRVDRLLAEVSQVEQVRGGG